MRMLMEDWEEYLDGHFKDLLERTGAQRPLLCLEHGLSDADVEELKQSIHDSRRAHEPISKFPLTWAVYATEVGYLYRGGEYWQTFSDATPNWWDDNDSRQAIKRCFLKFQKHFNGAVPSGPWAEHRTIISWPITHAILPRDLQRQLAQVLYQVRRHFDQQEHWTAQRMGSLIRSYSWDTTSRFQVLLEQPALVGQIALALLDADTSDQANRLSEHTVERIRRDLVQANLAKFWLDHARQAATQAQRTVLKGLGEGKSSASPGRHSSPTGPETGRVRLRPEFVLEPVAQDRWQLRMVIPDYSALLTWFPNEAQPLTTSKAFVSASSGRAIPPRGLLYGELSLRLHRWPELGEPVIQFQSSNDTLDALLQSECVLEPGPYLFKVGSDGSAKLLVNRVVRPNARYLVLTTADTPPDLPGLCPVDIDCEQTTLYALDLGESLSESLLSALPALGLQAVRQLELVPAGMPPARWDGEGSVEWLSSDIAAVMIQSRYPVERIEFTLRSGELALASLEVLPTTETLEPVYLRLPAMSAGTYALEVQATPIEPGPTETGILTISIRDPVESGEAMSTRGALQISIYPPGASLESLWDGAVALSALGPRTHRIHCLYRLIEQNGNTILFEGEIDNIALPMSAESWSTRFESTWQNNDVAHYAYGAAGACEVVFEGGDLGRQSYVFERDQHPLRWAHAPVEQGYALRLVDDGDHSACLLQYRSFEYPDQAQPLTDVPLRQAFNATESGLYFAIAGHQTTGIIVPPAVSSPFDIHLKPAIERESATLLSLLEALEMWGQARLAHWFTARYCQRQIMELLIIELFRLIGGKAWAEAEAQVEHRSPRAWLVGLASTVESLHFGQGWADAVLQSLRELTAASTQERVRFMAKIAGVSAQLAEFALRLASEPITVRAFAGDQLDALSAELAQKTTVGRLARFFVLVIRHELETIPVSDGTPQGLDWTWN